MSEKNNSFKNESINDINGDLPHFESDYTQQNSYIDKFNKSSTIDLDKEIPELNSGISKKINSKALILLLLIILVILGFFALASKMLSSSTTDSANKTPADQLITIPEPPPQPKQTSGDIQISELPTPPPLPQNQHPIEIVQPQIAENNEVPQSQAPIQINPQIDNRRGDDNFVISDSQNPDAQNTKSQSVSARSLQNSDTLLIQGTYIRCILSSKIVSNLPGNTTCIITEPIYSATGSTLLIPKGSKAIGSYGSGANVGNRIGIVWNRIITPNKIDIQLANPSVDNLGGAGQPGKYKGHLFSRLSSALLVSLISDGVDYLGDKNLSETTVETQYGITKSPTETNTARTLQNFSNAELSRLGGIPPTVTINQGQILNIYVSQDVDFSGILN